ncbi:hypothetical protein HCC36_11100 [Listeria booriae]|uniref:Uncharacterized protein n=1 Tax=Listeria booriae TaxID=1552123 RepID=A0A842G4V9_9LIST|nr:hypothetical protein [Listeria booriae]MBC2293776.1 hypothetical protein [Listeria booriae]
MLFLQQGFALEKLQHIGYEPVSEQDARNIEVASKSYELNIQESEYLGQPARVYTENDTWIAEVTKVDLEGELG